MPPKHTYKMNITRGVLLSLFITFIATTFAQNGTLKGVVSDAETGKTLLAAKIFVEGTNFGGFSKMDGSYEIKNIPPGTYTITASHYSKGSSKFEGIEIKAGETTVYEIKLGQTVKVGPTVVIELDKTSETVEAAVEEVKKENKVTEVISQEQMSRQGANTASSALVRLSGVSIEDGKYVYVRGLSDRYTKTMLNGSEIPGLDPNKNAVQLDLFPSSFLESIKVIKTFTPDLPGDFTGGLVDIRTKKYPNHFYMMGGVTGSYNSLGNLRKGDFISYDGGSTDWLGFDDGTRDFPSEVDGVIGTGDFPAPQASEPQYDEIANAFNEQMVPEGQNSFLDHRIKFAIGDKVKLKRKDSTSTKFQKYIGFFGGINYRRSYNYIENAQKGTYELGAFIDNAKGLQPKRVLEGRAGTDDVLWGALFNVSFKFHKNHEISARVLRNQSGVKGASEYEGFTNDDVSIIYRSRQLSYTERSVTSYQLEGEHKPDTLGPLKNLEIKWTNAYTVATQDQPDLRYFTDDFREDDAGNRFDYNITPSLYAVPARYSRSMREVNNDTKLHLSLPFAKKDSSEGKIKAGASYIFKNREFREQRLDYTLQSYRYNGDVSDMLSDENVGFVDYETGVGVGFLDNTFPSSQYDAEMTVAGYYAMIEYPIAKKLHFIGGARYEAAEILVQSQDPSKGIGYINDGDLLPSVNFIYKFIEGKSVKVKRDTTGKIKRDLQLRLAYSRTLARPNFRELAPYSVEDYDAGVVFTGNSDLSRSITDNFDLRFEYYPNKGEQISAAFFYKRIQDPIELVNIPESPNVEIQPQNNEEAIVYGVELDYKQNLSFITNKLKHFNLGFNVTFANSRINIPSDVLSNIRAQDPYRSETRTMFGSSKYLLNAFLEYENEDLGLNANIVLNVFGKRLMVVNIDGSPDIYELPRPDLTFNLNKSISDKFSATFRIRNILNPEYKWVYQFQGDEEAYQKFDDEAFVFQNFKRGIDFSLGITYKLDGDKKDRQRAKQKRKEEKEKKSDAPIAE